jgi:ATP-dependent DNA helicase RecQ
VRTLGHDGLSTFGIGADLADGEWRAVVRQLVAARLLGVEPEHSTLHLTDGSSAVLRGEREVRLRHDPAAAARGARRAAGSAKAAKAAADLSVEDAALFVRLREWRAGVAREAGLPAYVVFHDATLREVAARRPGSLDELAEISGVGAAKLERYGAGVVAVVTGNPEPKSEAVAAPA